jgi:hypothetical protein
MTKQPIGVLTLAALGLIVSCGTNISSSTSSLPEETALLSTDVKEKVGLKTVTGLSILSSTPLVSSSGAMLDQPWFAEDDSSPVTDEVAVEDFMQYITLMDTLLSEDGAPFTIVERVSDREAYDYLLDITTRDLAGFQFTYTLYFNYLGETIDDETSSEPSSSETITSEESSVDRESESEEGTPSEITISSDDNVGSEDGTSEPETSVEQPSELPLNRNDDRDEDDEEDDRDLDDHDGYDDEDLRDESDRNEHDRYKDRDLGDQDEDEQVFIEGIAILDGVEYALIGVQEIELDDDESETETKFFITLDDQNWIRIKSEVEIDFEDGEVEEKYSVTMKKDGEFSKMRFKVETEADGDMKVDLKTMLQGQLVSYTFRRKLNEETGQPYILIRVIENRQVLHILAVPSLDEVTGEIVYTFTVRETGKEYEGRPGHGNRGGNRR